MSARWWAGPGGSVAGGPKRLWTPAMRRAKFWARVNKTQTCWLWTGATRRNGYGRVSWDGRSQAAHGHLRTPENTRHDSAGWVECLTCRRERDRNRKRAARQTERTAQ